MLHRTEPARSVNLFLPPARTLGWAFYLASSWTWCIGMFFPILLLRDYGWWGFLVFAAPNVIGAAALGWVLTEPNSPARLLNTHRLMVQVFSFVTVVFQAFFLGWMMRWAGLSYPFIGLALFAVLSGLLAVRHGVLWLAFAIWCVSITAMGVGLAGGTLHIPDMTTQPPIDLLWIGPVSFFGFAFCPYLDITFLRAAASTQGPSRKIAFTLGFGVFFLLMIILTTLYGPTIDHLRTNASVRTLAAGIIFVHIAAQLTFTIYAHLRELAHMSVRLPTFFAATLIGIFALTGLALLLPLDAPWVDNPHLTHMGSGEYIYRLFLSFYGLVFPAYVWLCMIPTADGHSGLRGPQGRRKTIVWIIAIALAGPLFGLGFLHMQEVFLIPGLLIVLLARLMVRSSPKNAHLSTTQN